MFAGKTDILLKEISRAKYGGNKIQAFKPAQDDRWNAIDEIRSHSGGSYPATAVQNAVDIIPLLQTDTSLVAIDEIQFFDPSIVDVICFLLDQDIRVIFAGLPLDFRGEPFGSMPKLLSLCDEIDRPSAICNQLVDGKEYGQEATKTQRLINGKPACYDDPIVLIGAEQEYQARCPNHHQVPGKPKPSVLSS